MRAEPFFCTQAEVPLNQHNCPPCPPVGRFPHGRVARKMISFSAAPERKSGRSSSQVSTACPRMNCRPAKITQQPAGPPLNCHSSHIRGARGVMGGDLQNSRGLISFSGPHQNPTTVPPESIFMGCGKFEARAEGNSPIPRKPDSPEKPRQAPSCPVQQQCHLRRAQGSASSGAASMC